MKAVDTNILVYAHRGEFKEHAAARTLLLGLADGEELWGIPVFCLGEFLRVVTHPIILHPPTPLKDAITALEVLLESASLRVLLPGEAYCRLFLETIETSRVSGNVVFDAQIAALCREHGVRTLISNDRDFDKFPDLEIQSLN